MQEVTVVIPTHRRPEMLRCALASVAAQSARSLISRVIVSENSDDPRSIKVCEQFKELPIQFVGRRPPLEPGRHFCQMLAEVETDFVAMLADDDLWSRHHIEDSRQHLSSHPEAVAYFGQTVVIDNSSRQVVAPYGRTVDSLLPPVADTYATARVWGRSEVLLESVLRTPLIIWSMVGRTSSVSRAMFFMSQEPGGLDSDRHFGWRLSEFGPIIIGSEVGLFMRLHGDNACARMAAVDGAFHRRKAREYSMSMIREADDAGIPWRQEWADRWRRLSPTQREQVWGLHTDGTREVLKAALGPGFDPPDQLAEGPLARSIRGLIPPVFIPWPRALLHRTRSIWRKSRA